MTGNSKQRTRFLPGGIRARLFLLIALVLLPMVLLLGWVYLERYQTRVEQALQTELEVAQGVAATFAAYVDDIRRSLFATGEAIITFERYTEAKAERILDFVAARFPAMRGLNWVSPTGKVLAASDRTLVGRDFSDRPYFRDVLAGRPWAISDLLATGKDVPVPVFGIAAAIRDENGEVRGVLVAGIEPDRLGELIFSQQRPPGGAYAIFDRQGTLVYSSLELLPWEARVRWRQTDPLLEGALRTGEMQIGEVLLDIPGGKWLSARVPIPEIGWVVGAGSRVETALAPVRERLLFDASLATLIAITSFLFAWLLASNIARPLQHLETDAAAMGAGELIERPEPAAPDEVRRLRQTVSGMAANLLRRNAALRQSEAELRQLAETLPQLVWVTRADGYHEYFNQLWYEYTGTTPEETAGELWSRLLHPDDYQRTLEYWHHCLQTGESYSIEYRFRHAGDGTFRWFLGRATPLRNEAGEIVKWFGTCTDIHELRIAQGKLQQLKDELEVRVAARTADLQDANREMEAFSYTVSHDLRAPLRHIAGFIDLLKADLGSALDEKDKNYMRIIAEAAARMAMLIDDLLQFSRLSRAPVNKNLIELPALIDEIRLELAAEEVGRRIDWRIGALAAVEADPLLLRTVMTNLLANALKYTRQRDPAVIEIGSRGQGSETLIFVRDNGAGFDMRYVDKLFGVFQRLHPAEQFEGTGIGLASVRRIVERHGGRVWAEGAVDQGATFFIALPA